MASPRVHLILDFDGTVIKNNTLPFFDYLRQNNGTISYSSFLDPYMREYTQHVKDYRPVQKERTKIQQEYDFLESLLKIERNSIERIESSGWLQGLKWSPTDVSAFDSAASHIRNREKLSWRPGFATLVKEIWVAGGAVNIVSVNWSSNFIRALLKQAFESDIDVNRIVIYSNEIDPTGSGCLSRIRWQNDDQLANVWSIERIQDQQTNRGIWTAQDKAQVMRAVIKTAQTKDMISVYVGDSKTDLQCIMAADIGICVRDEADPSSEQTSLKEVLDRLEIQQVLVEKLGSKVFNRRGTLDSEDKIVYHAQDFNDIRGTLLNLMTSTDYPTT